MHLRELWQKIKTLSTVGSETKGYTHTVPKLPYIIESKEFSHVMSNPEAGRACNTCQHYHLQVELMEGQTVPPAPQHDYDEEELINLVKVPIYFGLCSVFLKNNMLIHGVRSDQGCPLWTEKPVIFQFDDNVIESDDGTTPVVPKVML